MFITPPVLDAVLVSTVLAPGNPAWAFWRFYFQLFICSIILTIAAIPLASLFPDDNCFCDADRDAGGSVSYYCKISNFKDALIDRHHQKRQPAVLATGNLIYY